MNLDSSNAGGSYFNCIATGTVAVRRQMAVDASDGSEITHPADRHTAGMARSFLVQSAMFLTCCI